MTETSCERRHLRRGDKVMVLGIIYNTWTDADAARRKGDDGMRVSLTLPSGAMVHSLRLVDVVPVQEK